jgi:small subunit ribosomal protein S1
MVSKHNYKNSSEFNGGPPPLDESWWEAVLTEDDERYMPPSSRPASGVKENRALPARPAGEAIKVDWDFANGYYEQDRVVSLKVYGFNRGGLLVSGEGLQGFVPVSHLVDLPAEKDPDELDELLAEYLDSTLQLKIIECDRERGRVVFSERAALASPGSRNLLMRQLHPGMCVQGTVTNITDFGVFVDLGGIEGLVHVSEISWGRVRHPSDVVRYGERVDVYVIHVEPDRSRVALSIKRLHPNPWETAEERYFPGQLVEAIITCVVPFGAFARLEEGLDGLIHVSEMGPGEAVPEALLQEGQDVRVRVLQVDAAKQRLGLSLVLESEE